MSQLSARIGLFITAAFAASSSVVAHADENISKIIELPPLAVCEITAKDTGKSYVIWHLTAYDEDGTRHYRAITSNLMQLAIKQDGSIESDANPCIGDLTYYASKY